MAEEFTINSSAIESKINQLLPSQGGFAPGLDFSASTMVIPIVDLTETAEGSGLRQDLQTSLSLTSVTAFNVSNTTTVLANTVGYFRLFGVLNIENFDVAKKADINITDGTTTKELISLESTTTLSAQSIVALPFDFVVFLKAGDSLRATSTEVDSIIAGSLRQIADGSGNLVSPL